MSEYDNSNTNQTGYKGENKMGSLLFGLENQIDTQKSNYTFYYNVYDRKYDERGTIDKYESEVLGIKHKEHKPLSKDIEDEVRDLSDMAGIHFEPDFDPENK